MALSKEERNRILENVAIIYAAGYAEGMDLVATEYGMWRLLPRASLEMQSKLELRLNMVEESMDRYVDAIERKASELRAKDMPKEQVLAELTGYARTLTARHADTMAQVEYAKGRMDGAKSIMDESGTEYEFDFPHFDLATPGHDECPVCEAIAAGAPYTPEQAEALGYPDVPHPGCDHGFVIVPKGEISRTNEFPQGPS